MIMKKKELINELTIDEKIALFGGNGPWHFRGITRFNIPDIKVSDGPHGVRVFKDTSFKDERIMEKTSLCPSLSTLSNSFNKEVAFKIGKIIGEECNHYGVRILLAPGTNLKRNPLGGRNFEYFSEDPILSGFMASNYINGVQSTGVGTSLKHFILNEQETLRRFTSSEASNKIIRELYAKPFEMAIKDANPYTIMCSYNKVNGV